MDRPTAESIRVATPTTNWGELGFPTANPDSAFASVVEQANAYVEQITGRLLDSSMPSGLAVLAIQAVTMRVQQIVAWMQEDAIESATDDGIQSFTVPGYSETRRDLQATYKSGLVNGWRALHELLWLLMTDAKKEEWEYVLFGRDTPAMSVQEVDWGGYLDVEPRFDHGA